MVESMETRFCPACRTDRIFEQPPCPEGHLDCPEWACVECGSALMTGSLQADQPARTRLRSHAA